MPSDHPCYLLVAIASKTKLSRSNRSPFQYCFISYIVSNAPTVNSFGELKEREDMNRQFVRLLPLALLCFWSPAAKAQQPCPFPTPVSVNCNRGGCHEEVPTTECGPSVGNDACCVIAVNQIFCCTLPVDRATSSGTCHRDCGEIGNIVVADVDTGRLTQICTGNRVLSAQA